MCFCFLGARRSSRSIASMTSLTGSSTLPRGGGFFRFAGTGDANALATVFRDTLYR
ncbi:hypothetical protein GCM10009864_78170 [Streptomyces lunalinharesii]|uniref:Uncharacterized protein n=1 Tax=Streptomyces lunalinharesii TaxID=333384 RepID=A0ABN3T2S7_9ACTN